MSMQAQVRRATRLIEAVGHFPSGSPDPNIDTVELRDDQLAVLSQPGTKTLNADGTIMVTPPAPLPPILFDEVAILANGRTTGATPTEIVRHTLPPTTGYAGQLRLIGVDAGNGAMRVIVASFAVKRLNAGALSVGAPVVMASHADAAASTWTVAPSVQGNDVVISVTGAAGRTIDWHISGSMLRFAPSGLP